MHAAELRAFDGDSGAMLYSATAGVGLKKRFVSPSIAKGRIYYASAAGVHAFTL